MVALKRIAVITVAALVTVSLSAIKVDILHIRAYGISY